MPEKNGLACKDPKELFPADYSKIDELLKSIPQDLSLYTSDSVSRLNQAIDSIDRSYNAAQQKLVDAMADTLKVQSIIWNFVRLTTAKLIHC